MITATSASRRGATAWSPRPGGDFQARKRYALKLIGQAIDNNRKHGLVKRKRPVFTYSSSSDTDEDEPTNREQTAYTRRHSKRLRAGDKPKSVVGDGEDPLGIAVWDEGDLDDAPGGKSGGSRDELFFALDPESEDELTVEYARSSESLVEEDLSDIDETGRVSPDEDVFDESSSSSSDDYMSHKVALCERPEVQQYIRELPGLLTRRRRMDVLSQRAHYIDDEPLRVKFLNRQFKHRLNTGDFTEEQIQEVILQRPLYGTFADLNIPTPRMMPEPDNEYETCDLTELDLDELVHPERPSTPVPQSDSDSESDYDSDEEVEPVYSASQVSEHLSRREMESLGIYPDDEE